MVCPCRWYVGVVIQCSSSQEEAGEAKEYQVTRMRPAADAATECRKSVSPLAEKQRERRS